MLWLPLGTTLLVVVACALYLALRAPRDEFDAREELAKLKRTVEERDLDWVDMRARCKRLLDRTEKAAKAVSPQGTEEPNGETLPTVVGGNDTHGRFLTDHQQQIQQKILRRRAGM
jgi:hypothetical protein